MSYYPFKIDNMQMGWRRETAFRTTAEGLDTTNANSAVYYSFGIKNFKMKLLRFKRNKNWVTAHGYTDWASIEEKQYEALEWELEGDLCDLMMLKMLVAALITNTDATSYRTRVYATTTSRSAEKPSIQVFQYLVNDTGAQTIANLLLGTQLKKMKITWAQAANVKCTFTFESAKPIAFTALTSPGFPAKIPVDAAGAVLRPYNISDIVVSLKKGGTAYQGVTVGGSITYDDGAKLHHGDGEAYAGRIVQGFRQIMIENLRVMLKEKALYDDVNGLAATAASDVDLTIKMSRNTTSDYLEFAFQKLLAEEASFEEWENEFNLVGTYNYKLKPASFETGAVLTITQADSHAVQDARVTT